MPHAGKTKNELLALTGAVYSFVVYLTAITLELLFVIDSAKTDERFVPIAITTSTYLESSAQIKPLEQVKLPYESLKTHITVSCLAISILYFVMFVSSVILAIALIVKSTLLILIWLCISIIMYLPELGLIIYVTIYEWGIDTRNGQAEFIFYLFRAALNVIFICRTLRTFKNWNHEKNLILKSNSHYDDFKIPYFINGTITTTVNPIFSPSTMNLNYYDQIQETDDSPASDSFSAQQYHHYLQSKLIKLELEALSNRTPSPYPIP